MSFNPDPNKQAQEVIFSQKLKKIDYSNLIFNNNIIKEVPFQKYLGLILDFRLTFNDHIKQVLTKVSKTISLIRKLQPLLPLSASMTIYRSFARSHLDYWVVTYIRGTSTEKRIQESGTKALKSRSWFWKLCLSFRRL